MFAQKFQSHDWNTDNEVIDNEVEYNYEKAYHFMMCHLERCMQCKYCPEVCVKIKNKTVIALIDSGAQISEISD